MFPSVLVFLAMIFGFGWCRGVGGGAGLISPDNIKNQEWLEKELGRWEEPILKLAGTNH
jgi:hypothetical protein